MKSILCFLCLMATVGVQAQARLIQVDPSAETVTLKNFGAMDADVSGYWLCLGPGMYNNVGNYTNITGDFNLSTDEEVIIDITSGTQNVTALPDANGGLGLFLDNSDFGSNSGDQLLDYIQWGASNQNRVSQAINAGRWNDSDNFVVGQSPYNYIGGANDVGQSFWIDDAIIRLVQIIPGMDEVVIRNFDSVERDLSNYFFCTLAGIYPNLGNPAEVEVLTGDLSLSPGEEVRLRVLSTGGVVDMNGSIFLFSSSQLGFNNQNASVTRDFAQWGAANGFRVENAIATNRWDDAANFIEEGSQYDYVGDADDVGADFWESTIVSTFDNDGAQDTRISVFPNPARTQAQLRIERANIGQVDIVIMDAAGKEVQTLLLNNQSGVTTTDLDLSGLASGIYLIQTMIDGRTNTTQLIITE